MSVQSLFTPFHHKTLRLRNRFVMAPMTRMQSPEGRPNQAVVDYYARRAAADVGLILTEGTVVARPASKFARDIPNFHGDALPTWGRVAQAVHERGGSVGPQLWHVGDVAAKDPSGWTPPAPMEGPDSMSVGDIEASIAAFVGSARAAKELGFDCLELHGAHGYLIDQFFWTGTNHRRDGYGGATLRERSRFAVELVAAIRAALGPDFPILLRLSQWKQQDYAARLAATPAEMEAWLVPLAEAGVDIFHCSTRRFWEPEFAGSDLNFAGWAKKLTGRPTITVGSVGLSTEFMTSFAGAGSETSDLSELIRRFERGDFDLVAVGRALLQDPAWVTKIKEGREGELARFDAASMGRYY